MTNTKLTILGAGISGLVSAINLARSGFRVKVVEKRSRVGGSPVWHPSVHHQVFDLQKTSDYIGVEIAGCFRPVKRHIFYLYGRKVEVDAPPHSYVCEKGPRSTSIESFLYSEARREGVEFVFNTSSILNELSGRRDTTEGIIVATGLEEDLYKSLGIKHSVIRGFRALAQARHEGAVMSYCGDYTRHDFGYVAAFDDIMFALLFARNGVNEENLRRFTGHLAVSEGILFDNWQSSTGCIPLEINLVKKGIVLAGSISGMIDPFYLNGISGALVSGKIASLYFTDKGRALKDFERTTRNFRARRALKALSVRAPFKRVSFPIIACFSGYLKGVGVL